MCSEPFKETLGELKSTLSKRDYIALLLLLNLKPIIDFTITHKFALLELLTTSVPLLVAPWYVWAFYRKLLNKDAARRAFLILLILLSVAWAYGVMRYRSAGRSELVQKMKLGQDRAVKGDYDEAAKAFDDARNLAHDSADKSEEAAALCKLGQAQTRQGESEKARLSFLSCISMAAELNDYRKEALGYLALGELETLYAPYVARQDLKKSRDTAQKLQNARDLTGAANLFLGALAKNLGQIGEANDFYMTASNLYRDSNSPEGEASVLLGLGELKAIQGRVDSKSTEVKFHTGSSKF